MVGPRKDHRTFDLSKIYPSLTQREFEIIPHLVSGATAAEIGKHLDVSDETIKKHRRNICAKFGSSSVRDIHANLADFAAYYCGDTPLFRVCCEKMHHHVQVFSKQRKILMTLEQTFRTIVGPVEQLNFTAVEGNMPIRDVTIKNGDVQFRDKFLGQDAYVTRLESPAKTGDIIQRTLTMTRDFDPLAPQPFHYSSWILYPTGHSTLTLEHLESDQPPKFHHEVNLDFLQIDDPNLHYDSGDFGYSIHTFRPKLSQVMTIFWQ